MTLEEIKAATLAGHTVCHHNPAYEVQHHNGHFYIVCLLNQYTIGLTWVDGVTMNGQPEEFYIHKTAEDNEAERLRTDMRLGIVG